MTTKKSDTAAGRKQSSTVKPATKKQPASAKTKQLADFVVEAHDEFLTSNQGVRINDDQNTLKAGRRGPSLLEDHLFREKLMHFDHERIPERVVHARGSAAHGIFESYGTGAQFSRAHFLQKGVTTPLFTRFSTVAGSRGSSDLARDVRGFAVKFYTQEGIFDLVGNNMPVFFIQDAIKFPDFIHAVKPEPHNEIPQAQSAHDTFWDFISLSPESMHMVMWVMSDRAIPRSLRMMEGFGIHTFRLIDQKGKSRFVKFHWKPVLGMYSVLWDEALKISGKDPDFHRRDLWDAIESGAGPEWELGVQVIEEKDEFKYGIDLLDPTKLIPEELVPVQPLGKMTLNRNPDNFFAETEQVAFCISHIVPGIDFTDDPLLQGRLFSYPDTQLSRLGSPNFHELPINKSIAPVVNNQRDGHMRMTISPGQTSYEPNTTGGGCPFQAGMDMSGFKSFAEAIDAKKERGRPDSFFDHFSQATMFYNSQTETEKEHIASAFKFELGHCEQAVIRERVVAMLERVDKTLAQDVAAGLGITLPAKPNVPMNQVVPADVDPKTYQSKAPEKAIKSSKALSMILNPKPSAKTRKVAVMIADGFDAAGTTKLVAALVKAGAVPKIIAPRVGMIKGDSGAPLKVDFALSAVGSVLFDGVFVPGGASSTKALAKESAAVLFVNETYKHCKAIGAEAEGVDFIYDCLSRAGLSGESKDKLLSADNGVVAAKKVKAEDFISALAQHRCWDRIAKDDIAV
jgi:catalase